MKRSSNYQVGDFVKYQGSLSTLSEILRSPNIGRIEEFSNSFGKERIYLYLPKNKQHIWCDFYDIRPIFTEPEHLRELKFQTLDINGVKKYVLNGVTVSGCVIMAHNTTYILQYCIGDLTMGVQDLDRYFSEDGSLNLDRFHSDFPDVNNVNDLFSALEERGFTIDKEKVLFA